MENKTNKETDKTETPPNNEKEKDSDKDEDDQMKPQNLTCCILMLDILLKQVNNMK